jgi:hypothetical protein
MSIKIRNDSHLRSLTGLNQEQFEILLETFTATCAELREQAYQEGLAAGTRRRRPGGGGKDSFPRQNYRRTYARLHQADGFFRGYFGLVKHGYIHKRILLSRSGDPAHVSMPGVHRIASLFKRVLLSTHQGAVRGKHLDYYLDEYTFRFNRRTSISRGFHC